MARDGGFRVLDRTDRAIVGALQERARDSYVEIGKAVGLSPTSVAERIRRLEEDGILLGYRAIVAGARIGCGLTAFILARPIGPDARFAKLAAERPEIVECHRVTGDVSFLAKALISDVRHLERVLDHLESSASYVVTLLTLSTSFERPIDLEALPMSAR